jgi:protein-arginine deiminase
MLLPSPRLAVAILRRAEQAAPGCLLNRGTRRADSQKDDFCDTPVEAVLGDPALMADQEYVQKKIDGVRRTLQAELGVPDADIVEIPVLFNSWPGRFAGRYGALTPNMVNSLQVGKTLILTDPHGPLVGGRDVLLQAVKDSLEPLGCRVVTIDDFYPYHRYGGEVHCGTNATRHPPVTR